MHGLVLEVLSGPSLASRQLKLDEPRVLGRSPECDWVLADPGISRRHAGIEQRSAGLFLRDLDSRAGTFVNDHAVDPQRPVPLAEHDRVRIGPWRFRVRRGEAEPGHGPSGATSAVSLGSVTHVAAPVLAAERRLELLVEFAATTVSADSVGAIVRQLCDFAQRGCAARVASVWLHADRGFEMAASMPTAEPPFPCIGELLESADQGSVVQADIELPGNVGVRPVLGVALRVDKDVRGYLLAELRRPDARQRADAAEFAHALARLAGLTLGNVERRDIERRVERLSADLDQAREVQRQILPPEQGVCAGTRYAFHVHPGRLVAGDFVDVFALDECRCAVVLGDVAGAGVGAGFLMASVQAYLHAELLETRDPALAARRCNQYVSRVGGGRFATAWIGVVDARARQVHFVDAGHGHGRHIGADGEPRKLTGRGAIPLGIDATANFEAEVLSLHAGERLVLYSDGIAEIRGSGGTTFEPSVLDQTLRHGGHPQADVDAVIAGIELFAGGSMPSDDASILAFDLPD